MIMKKITAAFIFCFAIMTVVGQNGLREGRYFLLQNDKKTISVNTIENNSIKELRQYPISDKSIYTTDQKMRVAVLDTSENKISLFDIHSTAEITLTIPFTMKPMSILMNDYNIFIGGEMGGVILVQYHIESAKWFSLEIPTQALFPRKAIDDLVINDTLLIAIDNIVVPKYVLYYHLNTTDSLIFSHFLVLQSNGPYEGILQGRLSGDYLGLYSTTFSGYIGTSAHITIYKDISLNESFAISSNQMDTDFVDFNDFIIVGNKVVLAGKGKGLGVFVIKESYFKQRKGKFDSFNSRVKTSNIDFMVYGSEEIIALTKIPDDDRIVLTIAKKSGKIRHELLKI
jgi:hypothetical protein